MSDPDARRIPVPVRLDADDLEYIDTLAEAEDRTRSDMIRRLLKQEIRARREREDMARDFREYEAGRP